MKNALIYLSTDEMRRLHEGRARVDADPIDPALEEPGIARRLPRKFARGIGASFTLFRRIVRTPLSQGRLKVGREVILPRRHESGRIEEMILGMHSGATTYAVKDPFLPESWVLLVPSDALTEKGDAVELTDQTFTVAVPRELALVA